jgi:hypothetical protein
MHAWDSATAAASMVLKGLAEKSLWVKQGAVQQMQSAACCWRWRL